MLTKQFLQVLNSLTRYYKLTGPLLECLNEQQAGY